MKANITRTAAIFLENDSIGDGAFVREVSASLRQYADLLDSGDADYTAFNFKSHGGTKVTILAGAYNNDGIPP